MASVDDDDDEISARLRALPDAIETEWPEAIRLSLAFGKAVRVEAPVSKRSAKRSREAVERLVRDPAFQAEARRIFALVGDYQPFPSGGHRDEIRSWDEAAQRRAVIIRRESETFAAAHRYSYISPPGVVAVFIRLLATLHRDADGRLPKTGRIRHLHDTPVFYVNPLTDTELVVPVEPGHILVDFDQCFNRGPRSPGAAAG